MKVSPPLCGLRECQHTYKATTSHEAGVAWQQYGLFLPWIDHINSAPDIFSKIDYIFSGNWQKNRRTRRARAPHLVRTSDLRIVACTAIPRSTTELEEPTIQRGCGGKSVSFHLYTIRLLGFSWDRVNSAQDYRDVVNAATGV